MGGISPSMGVDTMLTDDQLREALIGVLEADGWTKLWWDENSDCWFGIPPEGLCKNPGFAELDRECPHYDRDLNAIVERVGRLQAGQWEDYVRYLVHLCQADQAWLDGRYKPVDIWFISQAPAPSRLHALWQALKGEKG